jgi:hypothetical protein
VDRYRLSDPEGRLFNGVNLEVIDLHLRGDVFKFGFESEIAEFWVQRKGVRFQDHDESADHLAALDTHYFSLDGLHICLGLRQVDETIEVISCPLPADTGHGEHFAHGEAQLFEGPFSGLSIIPKLFTAAPPGGPE